MTQLRYTIAAVVVALTFLFNVERLDLDDANAVNLSSFVYVLGFLVVLSPVLLRGLPAAGRWTGALGAFWVAVYLVCKLYLLRGHRAWGGMHSYITLTELALLVVLSLLSSRLAAGLREFEQAVAKMTLTEVSRKVRLIDDARDEIQERMLLSRRHQRPLSVLVFGLDRGASAGALHRIVEEVQRGLANRYAIATLANALVRSLRRTDLPLEQGRDGRFVVLCPETDAAGAERAALNVRRALLSELGVQMNVGIAAFPSDALTFEELVTQAESRLAARELAPTLPVSQERV